MMRIKRTIQIGIIILISFLNFNCSENLDILPKYSDFKNDLERKNLFNNVKSIELKKANIFNEKVEDYILVSKEDYSRNGKITYQEFYDNFGEIEQRIKNKYENSNKIKTISENLKLSTKSIEYNEYDEKNRCIFTKSNLNNTIIFSAKFEYDTLDNPIKQIVIQNKDTSINTVEYKYNKQGKILLKKENYNSNKFLYNKAGKLIETISKSEYAGELKTTYKYDSRNRIKFISQYQNGLIERETKFDKYYNPISIKYYMNGKINKILKFEYKFDKNGNWIEKTGFLSENPIKTDKFIPIFMEKRKIKYYE